MQIVFSFVQYGHRVGRQQGAPQFSSLSMGNLHKNDAGSVTKRP